MKFFLKIFARHIYILISIVLCFLPIVVSAAGLVPCGGVGEDPCEFKHLVILVNNIINDLLLMVAIPLAAVMFMYAGYKMITAGGVESKITEAKKIIWGVLWGLLFAFGAWVLVKAVLITLGVDDSWTLL